ncbi:sugar phosphate isomerase/epimerase family protein [Paenibacillus sacheonensis]|uniref:TIM barrel protein n=1 Tax=Paenibacillus sacheonensis TaxID=742054 RepID=A0A7X4YR47_9BACL|nr:sugar phosphate isomerase/epimerase family protein [Paenibacillus sacheonensis]MBM7565188.1 sugar phosphate isomerase/epimerase [Paenibacillus sacheonensis]NBC70034.1 TIM barrel protein [Paenibacillus sacheonensis]
MMFPFKAALNASTLFPFKLNVLEQVRVAANAGYEGIELWVGEIEAYLRDGGTTAELRECLESSGVVLANAIAFFKWADNDEAVREEGFAQAEREMRMLAELGCAAVAAPPFGDVADVPLADMARHYARLAALGRSIGIDVYLEFWGRASTLSRIDEAVIVQRESGVNGAKLLLDPFHMYTGGSEVDDLKQVNGSGIGIFHVNDYPANPPRAVITDAERVFPGEGVAPSAAIARQLYDSGYRGFLSLELFIADFGGLTAADVAEKGLAALKAAYSVEA